MSNVIYRFGVLAGLLALFAAVSCEGEAKYWHDQAHAQLMLVIDADETVQGTLDSVRLEVFGDYADFPRTHVHTEEYAVAPGAGSWPRSVALAPLDNDAERKFRFIITGSSGGVPVIEYRGYGYYPWYEIETFKATLTWDCISNPCPNEQTTCTQGRCIDARIDVFGLHRSCFDDTQCDDSVSCTLGRCEDGVCTRTFDDSVCGEEQRCLDHGCEFGQRIFQCDDGQAIESWRLCDGDNDCAGGEDERLCQPLHRCPDGSFALLSQVCDGVDDCTDGGDELYCSGHGVTWCDDNSQAVETWQLCNGIEDCDDGSDEEYWRCGLEYVCESGDQRVDWWRLCDGIFDCVDGSDEFVCIMYYGRWW